MSAMRDEDDTLEDLSWLDQSGVGATEAAARSGFASAEAMEKWLHRHGHYPLWLRLKSRDPAGTHNPSDRKARRGLAVTAQLETDTIDTLLNEAAKSCRAATRRKAERARDLIGDLRDTLGRERADDEARKKAREEVEKLQRQLAEAKAVLRDGATVSDAAAIRAWAAENGVECPARGRISASVREAYEAAERGDSR